VSQDEEQEREDRVEKAVFAKAEKSRKLRIASRTRIFPSW
jgi:hypothetical protein